MRFGSGPAHRLTCEERRSLLDRVRSGQTHVDAAAAVGCSSKSPQRLLVRTGGVKPRVLRRSDLRLSVAEREEISRELLAGSSLRAVSKGKPIDPASVARYLQSRFGASLTAATSALITLADSFDRDDLARDAYALYEKFRPEIPAGEAGWGAAGALRISKIRALATR